MAITLYIQINHLKGIFGKTTRVKNWSFSVFKANFWCKKCLLQMCCKMYLLKMCPIIESSGQSSLITKQKTLSECTIVFNFTRKNIRFHNRHHTIVHTRPVKIPNFVQNLHCKFLGLNYRQTRMYMYILLIFWLKVNDPKIFKEVAIRIV